jgi:ABC-type sugar transport system permease subunit
MAAQAEIAAPPGPRARAARRQPTLLSQDRRLGYLLAAPVVIVLLVVTGYPLVYNLWNSFHHVDYLIPPVGGWAGVANYTELFTGHSFLPALLHTVGFTVVSVAVETGVGLALALALNKPFRGRGVVRAAIFIPWAVPTVVSAELWRTMFDPQSGFVNYVLTALHLPLSTTTWLDHEWTAWAALLIADAWRNTPFMAIVLLAGLQIIPSDVYEAARIDGAGAWKTFWRITVPLLKPALMVALIFRTLSSFLIFDVVYIMTGGGPGTSTQVLSYIDYQAFLNNLDFGYGGAIAVSLVVMALIIAAIYVRVFQIEEPT